MPVGIALVVLAAVCFGFMPYFSRLARHDGLSVEMLLGLRFGLAAVTLLALALWRGGPMPRGRVLLGVIALGAVGYVLEAWTFFTALDYAPGGVVSLLLYLYPALVTVLARLLRNERLTRRRVAALALALAGATLIIAPGARADDAAIRWQGLTLGVACAAVYALYILGASELVPRAGAVQAATIVVTSAAAVFLGVALAKADPWPTTARAWTGVGSLALVCTLVPITAFLGGLARVGPVRASTLSTIEPLATVLAGVVLMGESLSWTQAAGGGLVLLGAAMAARGAPAPPRPDPNEP
ncbi:MAG: EamA family transporter [Phycisphaerae bacterium]|nr:EamA family transporter [Phycisphaerae bacterium]